MRLLSFLLLIALMGCAQAPLESAVYISTGCQNLNDPFYDDAYRSGNVYFSPFQVGESVTVSLNEPDAATEIFLIISDSSGEVRRDLVTYSATPGEALTHTFEQDYVEMEVYWSSDAGVPKWTIACTG